MSTYSAGDIIGKTLIAASNVPVKKNPLDSSPVVRTIQKNAPIGVVYAYVNPSSQRKNLYWQFYDTNNQPYWVEHIASYFNYQALRDQGVLSTKEKEELKKRENESVKDFIERNLTKIIMVIAGVAIVRIIIQNKSKTS